MKYKLRGRHLVFLLTLATLTLLTSCTGGSPATSWFGVGASDDTVFLAANEHVYALNLESGAELWKFPSENKNGETGPFHAVPLQAGESVIVGGFGDGKLYAISQSDGAQNWVVETEAPIIEGAASTDGGVIVGNGEGEVFFVDRETGKTRTLLQADEPIWAVPLVDEEVGRVYVASMDHHLYAVDIESGEQLWSFEAGGALAGTPALSDGVVFFGALNSVFYAVDAETSQERWRVETDGWVWGGPAVDGDTVFFGDMAGKLYALDTADGSERWSFEAEGGIRHAPLLANDVDEQDAGGILYFGTREGKVYALRAADGAQQWAQTLNGALFSQPIIHAGFLLFSPHNAKVQLVALDVDGLAERWTYPPREE